MTLTQNKQSGLVRKQQTHLRLKGLKLQRIISYFSAIRVSDTSSTVTGWSCSDPGRGGHTNTDLVVMHTVSLVSVGSGALSSLPHRFFLDIASDSPPSDSVNHSLSFISDGNVLALHRLLWNNQERIGQYLSSNRSADLIHLQYHTTAVSLLWSQD